MTTNLQKKTSKEIGLNITVPDAVCEDKNCPFHGTRRVRGMTFVGKVIRARTPRNVLVEWERLVYIPKYERYERRFTKLFAHNPPCINAQEGNTVTIIETSPISKTKSFVVVQKTG